MPDIQEYPIRDWLWLSLALSAGSASAPELLARFSYDPRRIYAADPKEYEELEIPASVIKSLSDKSMEKADGILAYCERNQIYLLAPGRAGYPERLARISRMPLILYCKGKLPDIDREACVSLVGTRRMSAYGKRMTYEIAYDLARAGAIVISGLALGIDAIAHRACLDAGGFTVAVLGCGVDVTYPKENFELMEEIEKKGLIISEYPPGTKPYGSNFPTRNRIISGLSLGTVVIEADSKSGALITADYARKQGRDLFALPGMVGEQNSEGTNRLIQSGAVPITDARDILSEYELLYPTKLHASDIPAYRPKIKLDAPRAFTKKEKNKAEPHVNAVYDNKNCTSMPSAPPLNEAPNEATSSEVAVPPELTDIHADIYRAIAISGEPTQDEIISQSGLSASNAMVALTVLEIKGYILSLPGGRYTVQK